MDAYLKKNLISLSSVVCSLVLLFGSMSVAYSRGGGHDGGGGHHGGGGNHGGGWNNHGGGWNNHGGGWNRGYGGGLYGVGVGIGGYPVRGCAWVPKHWDRFGNFIPGHRAC